MGASGGGPHALACAALLGERVRAAVTLAGVAPLTDAIDWFAGMVAPGGLRAAMAAARRASGSRRPTSSTSAASPMPMGRACGHWAALGRDAGRAGQDGPEGLVDDDLAFVSPWGFDLPPSPRPSSSSRAARIASSREPRRVARWRRCRTAELWLRPRDGHVSVLGAVPVAMDWLLDLGTGRVTTEWPDRARRGVSPRIGSCCRR